MTTEFGSLIRQMARCVHILLLFAGPTRDHDGLDFYIESWGGKVTAFDTERSPDHDLLRDDIWDATEARIKNGGFDGNWNALPCSTFPKSPRVIQDLLLYEASSLLRSMVWSY